MLRLALLGLLLGLSVAQMGPSAIREFPVKAGSHPHDVAPAPDGKVWFTAQFTGELGILDPATGQSEYVKLGEHSAPHGVIAGPDGAAWITDGGLNAIVRVDSKSLEVRRYPLEGSAYANLNTAAFDTRGVLWFTGQSGFYGRLDPKTGKVEVWEAPRGRGPYGITATPDGAVYYASLAGNHIARIDTATGQATVLEPPTRGQGARRVWADSKGMVWISYWNTGQLGRYDPKTTTWKEWKLPGPNPQTYAVYVDEREVVWVSDFGANAIHSFDPAAERFTTYPLPSPRSNVRQILGRPGEIWLPLSGVDKVAVLRTR